MFSAGVSGKWDWLGHPQDAGLASPSNLEGFICSLPVPAATRSGFMNDFKHLSGDSNRTRISTISPFQYCWRTYMIKNTEKTITDFMWKWDFCQKSIKVPHKGKWRDRHWLVIRPEGMAWSSVGQGLGWILENPSLSREWWGTGTGWPGEWSQYQAWQSSKRVWKILSGTRCDSLSCPVYGQKLGLMVLVDPSQLRILQ